MEQSLVAVDFHIVKEQLTQFAASGLGKKRIEEMEPLTVYEQIQVRQAETTEARGLLDASAHIPLYGLHDITDLLERAEAGSILETADLLQTGDFIRSCQELKKYFKQKSASAPLLCGYSGGIHELMDISDLLDGALDGILISSAASARLGKLREQVKRCETEIQNKLNQLLNSSTIRTYLQEPYVSIKNGRYVLPVKAACRNSVKGLMVDSSGSGATVFIEPDSIRKLSENKLTLQREEEDEVYQIRAWLTAELVGKMAELRQNLEWMAMFDFIAARAKYSQYLNGINITLSRNQSICLNQARHPLLGAAAVPLTMKMENPVRTLLITGPNTGGKTVVLKTVGLFAAMIQSGLHVPAAEGSSMPVFSRIMADIGDEQSIQQSLSTFSGHLKQISEILRVADTKTLVLLDEIGTGTDPAEGAALAAAVLEELLVKGAITVASTHYGSLKLLAENHPNFENGAMTFDPISLKPLYELKMGESGSSHAFWIASRLGIEQHVIQKAESWLKNQELPKDEVSLPFCPVEIDSKVEEPQVNAELPIQKTVDVQVGDMVHIKLTQEIARVLTVDANKGILTVEVKGEKRQLGWHRVEPYLSKEVLYPEGYDMKVVLLSKEDRKVDKTMGKRVTEQIRVLDGNSRDDK